MLWVEIPSIAFISCLAAVIFHRAWRGAAQDIFSPLVLFSLMMVYYSVAGPMLALEFGDGGSMLDVYVRPVMWKGWLASAVAYSAFAIGYRRRAEIMRPALFLANKSAILTVAAFFFAGAAAAMGFWMFKFGGGLEFLNPAYKEEAAFLSTTGFEAVGAVYVLQFINLGFPAATLMLLYALEDGSLLAWVLFIVVTVFCVLFFLKSGFRYRLAWLSVGVAAAYFLWANRRPSLWLVVPLAVLFIGIMGLIGASRNYWGGLSMDRIAGMKPVDFLFNGFAESGTFFTLSQVIDRVPSSLPHTTWDPIWVALTSIIPRTFWADKPSSATIETIASAFGTNGAYEAGMMVPYFGEWYIAFGWVGIVVSSLVFGRLSRLTWDWFLCRRRDKFVLVIYTVGLGFMYLAFSRGLLAQVLMNFCFSLLPLVVIYRFLPKVHVLGQVWPVPGGPGRRSSAPGTSAG
jgi:hypothetical protein